MKKPVAKSKKVTDFILDEISVGKTLTSICKEEGMPAIQTVMKWCRKDKELDDDMHRARIRGTLIQADMAVDAQIAVITGKVEGDPKKLHAIVTAANNLGHQANAKLSKIDNRYKEKSQVENIGPMIIGFENEKGDVVPIGGNPPQPTEKKKPDPLSALTTPAAAGGGSVRKH